MFDKFNKNKTQNGGDQIAVLEKHVADTKRVVALQKDLADLNANQPMDLTRVMDMIGSLGTDGTIDQSIVDNMHKALGNNSNPIEMTKYFTGLIAKRVLTVADVRKIPAELFAYRGGSPLDITSARIYAQPAHLLGGASLLQPVRYTQKPLNVAFDPNGQITIGIDIFDNYTTNTIGTYASPFVAHLFILKRNDTLRGDSKFYVESEFGYKAGIQLTDDSAAVLVLNHKKAIKIGATSVADVATPPNLVYDLTFDTQDMDQEYELDTTTAMELNVTGTNVSVTHYQLPNYTPVAEAILAALIAGRLDMMPKWILSNLSAQFKF